MRGGALCRTLFTMTAFDDVLGQLREWDSEESPASLLDSLATEYRTVADQRDGASVLISERDQTIANLTSEVSRLKSEYYDLTVKNSAPNENENIDDAPTGIASLFTKREI